MQISTVSGDVRVDGAEQLGRVSVRTVSGNFGCCCAGGALSFDSSSGDLLTEGDFGQIHAESMSGDLRVEGSQGSAELKSMSGDVELEGAAKEVCLSSMSGDVTFESAGLPAAMSLSSKSGDCCARLPADPDEGFSVRYKTTSGALRSDFRLSGASGRGGVLQWGDGGTRTYSMSSVSGDLKLMRV